MGTKLAMSTAYSPQTDGQTERLNRTLEQYIRMYIDVHSDNWAQLLTPCEYAYNCARHQSTGKSPFELDCGRLPNDPMFMFKNAAEHHSNQNRVINSLDDYLRQMVNSWDQARNALQISQAYQKKYYDLKRIDHQYKVGDMVYLSTKREKDFKLIRFNSKSGNDKFVPRYLGPFKITRKASSHAYELDLPISMKMHPVVHIRYLKTPKYAKRFPDRIDNYRQPPELVGESLEYEVEAILKQKVMKYGKGFRKTYLVHWKGYPSEEDSWEPRCNLGNSDELLQEFLAAEQADKALEVHVIFVV